MNGKRRTTEDFINDSQLIHGVNMSIQNQYLPKGKVR